MARGASITVENQFNRGLITEATPINFPEQAVTETVNCVYDEFGRVTRRLGMDYEPGAVLTPLITTGAVVDYEWFAVENDGSSRMVVQQVGLGLYFYTVDTDGALSGSRRPFQVSLESFSSPGSTREQIINNECQFTTGRGYLFVTHPFCQPFYLEYDRTTDTIAGNPIWVRVRDITGIDDGLPIETKPLELSDRHRYNLFNQGWYDAFDGQSVLSAWRYSPFTRESRSDWPSNADIWWLYKRTALQRDATPEGNELFDPSMANRIALGNTPAPKGHYILDAFYLDRSAVSSIPGIAVESAGAARPTSCVFYAGRVWYGGVRAPKFSSRVYFSQLIERDDQFGRCYQINDPTSETTFDIIDTDGGTLELPLMEQIIAFRVLGDALLVLGTNGIYVIRGSDSGPFRATNYIVDFISEIGVTNPKSIVDVDSGISWWADDAIYALTPDQVGMSFQVQNISKSTIQSFLDAVPYVNRRYIKGAYSKRDQIVRWIYSNELADNPYRYDSILEMNVVAPSFYPFRLDTSSFNRIAGVIVVSGRGIEEIEMPVVSGGTVVETSTGDTVRTLVATFAPRPEIFKFFTIGPLGTTFSELHDRRHVDWATSTGGVSYESYGVSGYRIRGELLRSFTSTPVSFTIGNDQEGSLIVSGVWDYGARESVPQELYYRYQPPEVKNIVRRVKIRGKGKALQLKFSSTSDKPFTLYGWATFDTGGTMP